PPPYSPSFLCLIRRAPPPPLFPYTTLFRSSSCRGHRPSARSRARHHRAGRRRARPATGRARSPGSRCEASIQPEELAEGVGETLDRKSTRLNSSHVAISYAVFCLKKKASHW